MGSPLKRHIQQQAASYGMRFEDRQPPDGWVVELVPDGRQTSDEQTICTALAAWILSRNDKRMRSGEIDQFYIQHKSLPRKKGVSWLNDDLLEKYGLRRHIPKGDKSFFYIQEVMDNEGEFHQGEWIHRDWPHRGAQRPFLDADAVLTLSIGITGDFRPEHLPAEPTKLIPFPTREQNVHQGFTIIPELEEIREGDLATPPSEGLLPRPPHDDVPFPPRKGFPARGLLWVDYPSVEDPPQEENKLERELLQALHRALKERWPALPVSILTPYKAQRTQLGRMAGLHPDLLHTWDAMQGQQRQALLLSFVKTGQGWNPGQKEIPKHKAIGFLDEMRRLSVFSKRTVLTRKTKRPIRRHLRCRVFTSRPPTQ